MGAPAREAVWLPAALAAAMLLGAGCGGGATVSLNDGSIHLGAAQVSAQQLWEQIFADNPPRVIDIRPAAAYASYHIPHSENFPGGAGIPGAQAAQASGELVIVGREEADARAVALGLIDAGLAAKILDGGMEKWDLGLDIDDDTLKTWLDTGRDIVLIDVRTPEEFDYQRIPGSINKPLDQIEKWAPKLDPAGEYVMICRSGRRSATARDTLARSYGLRRVHNLLGGVTAWGYSLVGSGCG